MMRALSMGCTAVLLHWDITLDAAEMVAAQFASGGSASAAPYRLRASAIGGIVREDSGPGPVRWAAGLPAQIRVLGGSAPIGPGVRLIDMELFTTAGRPLSATAPLPMTATSVVIVQPPVRGVLVGGAPADGQTTYHPHPGQTGEDVYIIEYRTPSLTIRVRSLVRIAGDPDRGSVTGAPAVFLVARNQRSYVQNETAEVRYEVRIVARPGSSWRFALVTAPPGASLVDASDADVLPHHAVASDRVWVRWPLGASPDGHVPITVRVVPEGGGSPAYWFDAIRVVAAQAGGG